MDRTWKRRGNPGRRLVVAGLLAGVLASVGCKGKAVGDWQRSRDEYCGELSLMRNATQGDLDKAAADLTGIAAAVDQNLAQEEQAAQEPPPVREVRRAWERRQRCDEVLATLKERVGELEGFDAGISALTRGRGEQEIDAVGLSLDFGVEPLRTAIGSVLESCPGDAAAKAVSAAEVKTLAALDHDLEICRAAAKASSSK